MSEETCKQGQVERLDYDKPPPGYAVTDELEGDEPSWTVRFDGDVVDSGMTRERALAFAWELYKAENDPHGLETDDDHTIDGYPNGGGLWRVGDLCFRAESRAVARAAAWAWHDRREVVTRELEGENGPVETWPERCAWPRALTWSDEQIAAVERWLSTGGELPEVLRA